MEGVVLTFIEVCLPLTYFCSDPLILRHCQGTVSKLCWPAASVCWVFTPFPMPPKDLLLILPYKAKLCFREKGRPKESRIFAHDGDDQKENIYL